MFFNGKKDHEQYKPATENEPHELTRAFILMVDDNSKQYLPIPIPLQLAEANLKTIAMLAGMDAMQDGKGVGKPN